MDYSKVRDDSIIFKKTGQYSHCGQVFICPLCGLHRYVLGKCAKRYNRENVRCKGCEWPRMIHEGKLSERRATHLSNIKSRESNISRQDGYNE